jgi:hypothetical protein
MSYHRTLYEACSDGRGTVRGASRNVPAGARRLLAGDPPRRRDPRSAIVMHQHARLNSRESSIALLNTSQLPAMVFSPVAAYCSAKHANLRTYGFGPSPAVTVSALSATGAGCRIESNVMHTFSQCPVRPQALGSAGTESCCKLVQGCTGNCKWHPSVQGRERRAGTFPE